MLKRNAPSQQRKQCLSQNALQNDVVETTSSSVSLRNSEKTKLDHQDINNNENTLLLHAKTSLKRKLPLESTNTSIMIKKYAVLWRVVTSKKSNRKNWDGDGILHCQGNMLRLFDANGNDLGKKVGMNQSPETNQIYKVGNKEVEITEELTPEYLPSLGNTKTISFSIPSNALLFSSPPNTDVNTVYLDPILSKHLRPHQWLGVQFLYACVMGFNHPNYHGALLCDEMGCGKTLQSIALIWTLLKQNPIGKDPVANKVLIVCPASLIRLWQAEFKKWLGDERVRTFAVDSKSTFTDFLIGRVYPIMIIGYEKLVSVYQVLHECPFDLIICDEGHRLKSTKNKAAIALRSLSTLRRIILSGTPIQNDLSEYFCMLDFVNPGIIGTYSSFKLNFEIPIFQGQQPNATTQTQQLAKAQFEKLVQLTSSFVIRRGVDHIAEYLPPRSEILVYLSLSILQREEYAECMQETKPLEQLMHLRKLCNHSQKCNSIESLKWELYSPKCFFLQHFLVRLLNHTQEKLVIVSRFNSMLDHIERVLKKIEVDWFRLDGSTVLEKRSNQIETFNRPQHPTRVFLLSAKAGGLGLSLVGASRLILVDLDWNPAQDRQVMARIWREGQTKPVYIYRLIMQGTLEEIILQRQITKTNLSLHVLDGMLEVVNEFNQEELRVFRHPCFDGCSFKLKETFLGCRDDQVLESILNEEESALPMNVMTLKN